MYVLLDIGGTNTRLAFSKDHQTISDPITFPTNQNFEEAMNDLSDKIREQTQGGKIEALAGAVKSLDASKKTLKPHPVFPLWVNKPLHEKLTEITQAPVHLENDTALAGLGEAVFGAGKNSQIVVYLTISTGFGGVRVTDQKLEKSAFGFEIGFQIVNESQYLEEIVSGAALKKKYNKPASEINDPEVWEEMAKWSAVGVNNVIAFWSPEIIIFGGSLMKSISLESIKSHLKGKLAFNYMPKMEMSEHGDLSALYGGLAYLNQIKP